MTEIRESDKESSLENLGLTSAVKGRKRRRRGAGETLKTVKE